jgi:hypothetical protein
LAIFVPQILANNILPVNKGVRFTGISGSDRLKPKNKKILIGLLVILVFMTTGGVFWKRAKDEIFYLCGNFSAGVKKSSVIRQLETSNLSRYIVTPNENGSIIVFSSNINFVTNQCIIELDKSKKVLHANYK